MDERVVEAKERYKIACEGWDDIYDEAKDDLKFVYDIGSGQWPESIRDQREKDGRPVITVNKLQKFVRQLRGDVRQNRPRIKVIPVDDKGDTKSAELYNGLIRQIEYLSDASIAYDTAYMHAVSCSVGYFRLITKYADNSFNQDVFVKRILNPFSVRFDPTATEFTLEDAKYCFIEQLVNKEIFKTTYPNAEVTDFDGQKELFGDWLNQDKVRVCEYFWKEPVERKLALLQNGEIVELNDKNTKEFIESMGGIIVKERTERTYKVKWYKLNGAEILEESDWAGKYIPVIPVFGDEIVVDGKKHYLSLARGAKGPQEMYNFWSTAATETVALAPKNPYMVDHRQVKGFENEWEDSNRTNRMFIRYNGIPGLEKPERERQTEMPSAIMSMMQVTAFDIEDHLGRYEASKGQASNERSGKAIIARIQQSDKGTYTFIDNLSRAIVYAGRQIIDLIPKIYDTERALQVMGEDGTQQLVNVNTPMFDGMGNAGMANDLSVGQYDVIATIGASYGSKRQEMVDFIIQTMQYSPQLSAIIAPLAIKYSDAPGSQELYAEIQQAVDKMKEGENGKTNKE